MASSKGDYKKLKRMDYQQRARDALLRIENAVLNKKLDHGLELIAEFLFLEKKPLDSRKPYNGNGNGGQSTLTLIQEFQLVVVMSEFFIRPSPEVTKNAMFLSLFGGGSSATPYIARSRVLVRLISTAVSCSISAILRAAGTWMQQLGPTSDPCLELSQRLVEDFVHFSKKCSDQLKSLPLIAPRFTINFMTSVTDLYLHNIKNGEVETPPDMLLEVFTDWLTDNPTLCLVPQPPLALPPGAISMPVVTPLTGLISWCVLAPIYQTPVESPTYNRLHLAILQSLMQTTSSTQTGATLNALHFNTIIKALTQRADKMPNAESDERMQLSIERFAQAIQLAITARMFGNFPQLLCRLETLPPNTLMQIVIKAHKVNL